MNLEVNNPGIVARQTFHSFKNVSDEIMHDFDCGEEDFDTDDTEPREMESDDPNDSIL